MQETRPEPRPPGESGTHRYATLPGGQLIVVAPPGSHGVAPEWGRLIASADDVRAIAHLAVSQDGRWLASASYAGTVQLWRAEISQPIRSWHSPYAQRESVSALGLSPDGAILTIGYAEGTVELFKTQTAQSLSRWVAHKAEITGFAFLVKRGEILTGSTDGTLKFWNSRDYSELASIHASMNGIYSIAVSPEEDRLVTGSAEGTIKLWHTDLRQEIALFTGHHNQITELAFHLDGNTVVSMSMESVLIWRAPSLAEIDKAEATERITGWKEKRSAGHGPFGATLAPLSVSEYLSIRLENSTNALWLAQAASRLVHNSKGAPDQLEKADAFIAKAARWAPDDPEVLRIRAEVLERRGDWAGAMSLLNDAIGRHRQNPGLWRAKAAMLEETNRLEAAYQAFTKAVQIIQADTNRFGFLLEPVLLERSDLLRRLNRPDQAAADNLLARHIPPRDPQAPPSLVDLSAYYNATMTGLPGGPANHLTDLGTGIREFDGTKFDVRAVVHLRHPLQWDFPLSVEGIRVNLKCQRLHFLHSVAHALKAESGLLVGRYVIHFADGQTDVIELKLGVDLWDWHFDPNHPKATQNSKVAWSGTNDTSKSYNYMIQVFKSTWPNPRPDVAVESIDYISANAGPGPFLIAITAEP